MTERYTTTIESPWEIHPDKYQVMPRLSYDKHRALKNLIENDGINVPIIVDADMFILDGHHRREAWLDLLNAGSGVPSPVRVDVRADLTTDDEKLELVYSLNFARRNPSDEQREEALRNALKRFTHYPNGRIGDMLGGLDTTTVRRMREKMVHVGVIPERKVFLDKQGRWFGTLLTGPGETSKNIFGKTEEEALKKLEEATLESLIAEGPFDVPRGDIVTSDKPKERKPVEEEVRDMLRAQPWRPDQTISRTTGGALWLVEAEREMLEDAGEIAPQKDQRRMGDVSLGEIERRTGIHFPEPPKTPVEEIAFNKVSDLVAILRDNDLSGEDVAHHVSDDPTFAYGLGQDYDFLIDWIREFVVELLKIGEGSEIQQLRGKIEGS